MVVLPWQWQSEEIVRRVDAGVAPEQVIRLGPGENHYGDGDDDTLTHVRWLTTIADARINRKQHDLVSLVVDTDGIFLVHGAADDQSTYFQELRAADRDTLLAGDPRNRWLADGNIDVVELMQRPWSMVGIQIWMLTIWTVDGERHRVFLPHDDQVSAAHTHLPRLLGADTSCADARLDRTLAATESPSCTIDVGPGEVGACCASATSPWRAPRPPTRATARPSMAGSLADRWNRSDWIRYTTSWPTRPRPA